MFQKSFFVLLLSFGLFANASKITIYPVGKHGGSRLYLDCMSKKNVVPCMLDTGAVDSTFYEADYNKEWPMLKKSSNDGFAKIDCEVAVASDFSVAGLSIDGIHVCRTRTEIMREYGVHIGAAILKDVTYVIDLKKNEMSVSQLAPTVKLTSSLTKRSLGAQPSTMAVIERDGFDLVFDTGAPVTLVHKSLVEEYPKVFQLANQEVSDELKPYGITVYLLKGKLHVGQVTITGGYIYAVDLSGFWGGDVKPRVFLGMNHMIGKKWAFSPATSTWQEWD